MAAPMCSAGDLDNFRVTSLPDNVFYIPDFITEAEEKLLYDKVYSAPKPKWVQLSHRRLQNWGMNRLDFCPSSGFQPGRHVFHFILQVDCLIPKAWFKKICRK
ncbi:hypothetical protein HPB48_003811 [Haemaphysalis longicornis]|uniref:Uncharacterized protein n=1 Tax=Haemaphysalis longicornis TaxID=44386 RepID=A0A9J6GHW6_HAELO|nr:hypothetical protein HPB48_003811 [Haemaphysalis longicornis]